ncbi:uncharacterized protein TrAFT101_003897 [Trichoderma asperellum]|uniref:uncharacterized protein n=1 Tax=Trichoderma asperellum TaxID=101201 RepID=UPI0033174476|nr:hypothetical protein TrAFT101_003897 [Trichoderma asperellum]
MPHFDPDQLSPLFENEQVEQQSTNGENYQEANIFKTPDRPTIILVNSQRGRPESTTFKTATPARAACFPPPNHVNNCDGVSVRETFTRRGRGVFADRNFEKGENIITERPVFSCGRKKTSAKDNWPIAEEWCRLPLEHQLKLQNHFRKLRSVPIGKDKLGWYRERMMKKFFLEYAFCNPQRTEAHVYALGSHMNHACRHCANAEQWTESDSPNRILVKVVRPLKAGDEVLINYNKQRGAWFGCAICSPPGLRDRLGDIRSSISRLISRLKNPEDPVFM